MERNTEEQKTWRQNGKNTEQKMLQKIHEKRPAASQIQKIQIPKMMAFFGRGMGGSRITVGATHEQLVYYANLTSAQPKTVKE